MIGNSMNHTRRLAAFALAGLLIVVPCAAFAQDQDHEAQRGRPNRAAPPLTNAQLATMLDAYAIVQAQTHLQLTDDQYGQFVARLKRLQDTRRQNMQARNKMIQELRRLTAPGTATEEATLRDRVKALRDFDEQAAQTLRREYEALDEVLDPRQQARFRVFEEQIERQKLDLLVRARERARGAAPPRRNDGSK
jgi:hypothetical protein